MGPEGVVYLLFCIELRSQRPLAAALGLYDYQYDYIRIGHPETGHANYILNLFSEERLETKG